MREHEIYDILLDNKMISSVFSMKSKNHNGIQYELLISCDIKVKELWIPIYIGITNNWEQELFDFYIADFEKFQFIPHVDKKGKLCLFDLEGILIDTDFTGLLNTCIRRAVKIIDDGMNKDNTEEFIKEYSSYWLELSGIRFLKFALPNHHRTCSIKYTEEQFKKNKSESQVAYLQRCNKGEIFASEEANVFKLWNIDNQQKNGMYFYIHSEKYILPPDPRKKLDVSFINNILQLVNNKDYKNDIHKTYKDKLFVFHIIQPNEIETIFGVLIKNTFIQEINDIFQVKPMNDFKVFPLYVERIDKSFLSGRTSQVSSHISKKCLLIGCGSIGSYISNELIKAGFENVTLVDSDKLFPENIYRHFLGIKYVDLYKAEALQTYFNKNYPCLNLSSRVGKIRELVDDEVVDLSGYDFIISATGNHNVNRWLNNYVHTKNIDIPIIYAWNEPLDIGCHAALIRLKYAGCYECFFQYDDKTGDLFDITAFCEKEQNITHNLTGCGGSFIPYGSVVSLKSTVLCMDCINMLLDNRVNDNILISLKDDGYYFSKAGLIFSEAYNQQKEKVKYTNGTDFKKADCNICR